ncbi:MAG: Hpt domain-containing protein [Flammeovirgaceae bacterium]
MDKKTLYSDGTYDSRTVDSLLSLGDPVFIRELIDIFSKNTPEHLKNLQTYYQERNAWEMRQILHKMRGTCGTIGAKNMLAVVDAMREELIEENWSAVSPRLLEMGEVWSATYPYLYLVFNLEQS